MNPARFRRLKAALERRQPDLTVLMDGVHKPHNFSAILRSCDAVGILDVHVVPGHGSVKVHHGISAGTRKWVRVQTLGDIATAIGQLKGEGFRVVAAHPSPHATDYREADYTHKTAIVLGSELHGVSENTLGLADELVSIPLSGMVHSLNVSVAAALLLFEARRQREAAGYYDRRRLSDAHFAERLFEWAHPTVAIGRRKAGRPYPKMGPDGTIIRGPSS